MLLTLLRLMLLMLRPLMLVCQLRIARGPVLHVVRRLCLRVRRHLRDH